MRAFLPEPREDADVHAHYATDWLDGGGLRVNFVASVDGAVSAAGRSRGLQTPGDNAVFAALRDLADVVTVGAATAVAEGYRAVRLAERRRAYRRAHGLPAQLRIAVLSRTLRLDPAHALFGGAAPDARTLVLTCAAADRERRRALAQVAEVVDAGELTVEPALARQALEDRGFRRILCEGGPTAFAELAAAGVVDELCLSVTPMLCGPGAARITAGTPWGSLLSLSLVGLLEEDGALFCRYRTGRG